VEETFSQNYLVKINLFDRRDKLIEKDRMKPTELEENVAKSLYSLEINQKSLKQHLRIIFINRVHEVDY
jgi:hypothetical protein